MKLKKSHYILGFLAFVVIGNLIAQPEIDNKNEPPAIEESIEKSEEEIEESNDTPIQFDAKNPTYCDILRLEYTRAFSAGTQAAGIDIFEAEDSLLLEIQKGLYADIAKKEGLSVEQMLEICPVFVQFMQ